MLQPVTAAAIAVALILTTQQAAAQVYTCTVGDRKVYQSIPCEAGGRPIELYVPAPADKPANHTLDDHTQRYIQQREHKTRESERIVDQRAREAVASREAKEREQARKDRITSAKFNREVIIGMTESDVRDAWGRPLEINRSQYKAGEYREQWVYKRDGKRQYVYLVNGKVTGRN